MDYEVLFPGRFVKAAELKGRDVTLTITSITIEDLPQEKGGEKPRGIVSFRNAKKGLVLNRTNGECLRAMFGRETDGWLGKRVTLYPTTTKLGGETVPCIRIKGSPDISSPVSFELKSPRKKAVAMRLVPTGGAASATTIDDAEQAAAEAALAPKERTPGADDD